MDVLRAAAGPRSIRRGAPTRPAPNLLVFHRERRLRVSRDVTRATGPGSGVLAGGRVAHLFVAVFIGVVSRVSGLPAAVAAVGALRVEDLAGRRRRRS